ncbi:MAG: hypothetical protein A4E73_02606 [Syntrophaceae bacterium PtaU1.Bin231]|nr:MAG: hypothetical protein A4E73_02606 [Syntrophaceae bacterium PtaU1.Bin231]
MLDELHDHVLVNGVVGRQFHGELQHVLAEERHPGRAVGLLQVAAGRQGGAAVEDPDIVEAEEASLEDVLAEAVLAVHPPGEVQQQLVERRPEEIQVRLAAQGLLGAVQEERREGVDRGVHVAEVPLVGGHLAAGVQVDVPEHQLHLLLREIGVHDGERQRVEGQVPGRVPGVLPLVGHGDDVLVEHVEPLRIPGGAIPAVEGVGVVLVEPVVAVEVEELLAPEHAGDGLAHDGGRVGRDGRRGHRTVKVVRLLQAGGQGPVELRAEGRCAGVASPAGGRGGEAQPHGCRAAGRYVEPVVRRDLGALLFGVHRALIAFDDAVVDAVLDVRAVVRTARKEPGIVRFILGKEQRRPAFAEEDEFPELRMRRRHGAHPARFPLRAGGRSGGKDLPEPRLFGRPVGFGDPCRPVIPEPERRQQMQLGRLRSPVVRRDSDEDVFRGGLGVFHEDVEVAVAVEDAGVEELVLHLVPGTPLVGVHQVGVREGRLWVFVEVLHVRMGRRRVEVEVVFLHILAVIALAVGQPEEALLQNRVPAVPQRKGKAQPLFVVGQACQAVFAPAVGPGAGMLVGEEIPGVAPLAVVLAHRAPLPFAQVGAPLLPGHALRPRLPEADLFGMHGMCSFPPLKRLWMGESGRPADRCATRSGWSRSARTPYPRSPPG